MIMLTESGGVQETLESNW